MGMLQRCAWWVTVSAMASSAPVLAADRADAATTAACLKANDEAQQLRKRHQLSQSIERLKVCSQPNCPNAVQRDCMQWLHEVEAALPTLSFSAKNAAGEDLTSVSVWMDGTQLLESLTGTSVPVDPGQHTFRFDHDGEPSVSRDILVSEGDKARKIEVRFGAANQPTAVAKPIPIAPIVLSAVGGVALLSGLILYAERRGAIPEVCKDTTDVEVGGSHANQCQRGATQADVDQAKAAADVSYVGLGLALGGAATLAAGLSWLIIDRATPQSTQAARVRPAIGLGYLGLSGSF